MELDDFLRNSLLDANENSAKLREDILNLVKKYSVITHSRKPFCPGKSIVPVAGKVFDENDLQMLVSSSLDFWLTSGRFNSEFERVLGKKLNSNFVITVNSGSSANLLALSALTSDQLGERRLLPNDEVITLAAGFPTTVNPIIQNNLVPVFIDVDIPTYVPNYKLVEDAISDKTRAIMLTHTLGNPFDAEKISKLAKDHNLWLIEDCCDALGSLFAGKSVGTFGNLGTLSFYPAHHITMGEGGAVFTDDPKLKRILESFRDWGRDCFCAPGHNNTCGKRFEWKIGEMPYGYDHKFIYSHLGYNFKITDMQASVGLAQLNNLEHFIQTRKNNFSYLKKGLKQFEDNLILPESTPNSDPSWFGFTITIKENLSYTKKDLIEFLSSKLIDTRPLFAGNITKQPYFKNIKYRINGSLRNTEMITSNSFWIGVYPGLTKEMLDYVIQTFDLFFNKK
ncbi:MAG: lipopolysaccharide biosynthesis protein RfbH [Nanoarchaeota archaeon]